MPLPDYLEGIDTSLTTDPAWSSRARTGALQDPSLSTPARHPGSARRTSHIDMRKTAASSREGLELRGAARDLRTASDRTTVVVNDATLATLLGPRLVLQSLDAGSEVGERSGLGDPSWADALVGQSVTSGFRSRLQEVLPEEAANQTPLYLLLDDLPVAALISGYIDMYSEPPDTAEKPATISLAAQTDICAGWAGTGTMMGEYQATGILPIPVGPPAPDLDGEDVLAWHAIAPLALGTMRRRRLVDVSPSATELLISAMFRDTYVGPDGVERVLHEYELRAAVDPVGGVFTSCKATPRVLPWPECPMAALSAASLVSHPVAAARDYVRHNLRGLSTCTHLNDLLRSLSDAAPLARSLGVDLG